MQKKLHFQRPIRLRIEEFTSTNGAVSVFPLGVQQVSVVWSSSFRKKFGSYSFAEPEGDKSNLRKDFGKDAHILHDPMEYQNGLLEKYIKKLILDFSISGDDIEMA